MRIHSNNIAPGMKLWFRKKGSWDVDYLVVQEVGKEGFSFRLPNGREHRCSYKYASGRLFTNRDSLSTKTQKIEMSNTYGNWSGSPGYAGEPFSKDEFEHLQRIVDEMAFFIPDDE